MIVVRHIFLAAIAPILVLPMALLAIDPPRAAVEDVCDRRAHVLRTGDWDTLKRLSPEQPVTQYETHRLPSARWRYPTAASFPELANFDIWDVSRVDLNNDGRPDVRFTGFAGTAGYETTYVFTPTGRGRYRVLFHESGEARICYGDRITVVADRGTNYVAWYSDRETNVRFVQPTGKERQVCQIKRTLGLPRIMSGCSDPVCPVVARWLVQWKGADDETIAIPDSDPTVAKETAVPGHAMIDRNERHGLLVDIDNDRTAEFVTSDWHGRWGHVAEVFVRGARGYEAVHARRRWPGWPGREEQGVVFVGAGERHTPSR